MFRAPEELLIPPPLRDASAETPGIRLMYRDMRKGVDADELGYFNSERERVVQTSSLLYGKKGTEPALIPSIPSYSLRFL